MRSIAGAPSRVASFFVSAVNVPVGDRKQALVRAADHRAAEVSDCAWRDASFVPLTLKVNLERKQCEAQHTNAVDAAVATSSSHFYFHEP